MSVAPAAAGRSPLALPALPGDLVVERLANGLTVGLLGDPTAPVVTSALALRVGSRDEEPAEAGIAHFLEHMMFKGSARFGPGEIDRRTQELGGSNNAYTSHDLTVYHFDFAPDRWSEALAIEADRMAGLALDPVEVDRERQVILEEITMYEDEPWDALEHAVHAAFFGPHPYARPVLGGRASLQEIGVVELARFHRRWYRPSNAVLLVAGSVGRAALDAVEEAFGGLAPGGPERRSADPYEPPSASARIERRHGDVARLMQVAPGPPVGHPMHAPLRLLLEVLSSGRSSRLHRRLVDEEQLCSWVSADLSEGVDGAVVTIAAELVPGAEPGRLEASLAEEIASVVSRPPSAAELGRARRLLVADWVFGHQRVHELALLRVAALALFDRDYPERRMRELLAVEEEELAGAADLLARSLDGACGRCVTGWSLPRRATGEAA